MPKRTFFINIDIVEMIEDDNMCVVVDKSEFYSSHSCTEQQANELALAAENLIENTPMPDDQNKSIIE